MVYGGICCYGEEKIDQVTLEHGGDEVLIIIASYRSRDPIYDHIRSSFPRIRIENIKKEWIVTLREGDPENHYLEREKEIKEIFGFLEDKKSKEILVQVMRCRCGMNNELAILASDDEYYPLEIMEHLHMDEIFIDCGAYTGDTIEKFVKKVNDNYSMVFGFELDAENFQRMQEDSRIRDKRIRIFPYGIGNENGTIQYAALGGMGSSYEMPANSRLVTGEIRTLDSLKNGG